MDWYNVVKFLHVAMAVIWVGGGFAMMLSGIAGRTFGDGTDVSVARIISVLGNIVFMPASLLTLLFGIILVVMSWSFTDLWVIIGLAGVASAVLTGTIVFKPTADRITALVPVEGLQGPTVADLGARLVRIAKFDYVVLFVVIADMVLKPGWGDVVILGLMGAAVAVAALLFLTPRPRRQGVPA